MSEPILQLKNLKMYFPVAANKAFGKKQTLKAIDDISFSIQSGETFGLVGESGCGKTTVGRSIVRLYEPTDGTILYNKQDITHIAPKQMFPFRKQMQMIFQDPYTSLDPRMTVGEIIATPIEVHNIATGKEKNDRVHELIDMVGLKPDFINRYPHEFSGGQRQRVGIARALAMNPQFVVCDEPISALDVSIQAQIINILEELQEKMGLTYLFISHDLSMVRHISHTVGVMYLGTLVEKAPVDELYSDMLHPYSKALFSAVLEANPLKAKDSQRVILHGDVPTPINPPTGCVFQSRCSIATEQCIESRPPLRDVGNEHYVACFLV